MELHERLSGSNGSQWSGGGANDPFAEVKNRIHLSLVSELGPQLFEVADVAAVRQRVELEIREQLDQETALSRDDRERLAVEIADDIFGYGPLERLLADPSISEIMVNGPSDIWIERNGRLSQTIAAVLGRVAPAADHHEDGRPDRAADRRVVSDGRRPPTGWLARERDRPAALALRPVADDPEVRAEPVRASTSSSRSARCPSRRASSSSAASRRELNMLISGGTGSGKTTLLNALSAAVPDGDRIVTIEDAAELQLDQRHVLRLESRPKNIEGEGEITIRDLVRNALRMRPDRIIVGEVRGAEALDMLQAMNTGHEGSLSTIHANSPRDALNRLETMVLMAGFELPLRAIRQHVSVRARPDRADRAARRRHAPVHVDHGGAADGG